MHNELEIVSLRCQVGRGRPGTEPAHNAIRLRYGPRGIDVALGKDCLSVLAAPCLVSRCYGLRIELIVVSTRPVASARATESPARLTHLARPAPRSCKVDDEQAVTACAGECAIEVALLRDGRDVRHWMMMMASGEGRLRERSVDVEDG